MCIRDSRERIDHVYPSLRPAERAVAQYIRNHIEEAADLTVGQMADIAHVSQPTVIPVSYTHLACQLFSSWPVID